jgi:two-component system cell cycle sensor histidine kinase/response regulator CckA
MLSDSHVQPLLDAMPDAVVIIDADGNIERINAQAELLFGYSAIELGGRPFALLLAEKYQQALAHAREALLGADGVTCQRLSIRALRSDAIEVPIELAMTRLDTRVIATARDVTALREAERARRGSSRLLEACFKHMLTQVAILDPSFNFIRVNDAYARGTGHEVSYFPGKNHFELFPSDAKAIFERVIETCEPFQTFARPFVFPTHPEWGVTYWDWTLLPICDEDSGKIELLMFVLENATERVRTAEELRLKDKQLMEAKQFEVVGQLAAGIAHDFNNVLTSVLFTLDLLKPTIADDPPLVGIVDEAFDIVHRAKTLTYQLLSFGRKQLLQPELVEINDAMRERSTTIGQLITEKNQLRIVTCESGTCFVKVDRGQLDRIILNLAANAADAMPEGGMLTVMTTHVDIDAASAIEYPGLPPGAYVMLSVVDNGIGMDKATCERVFDPFFSTKQGKRNAGLGLSSVQGIVKQSGGEIFVHSKPGEGTTFKILFPRVVAPDIARSTRVLGPAVEVIEGLSSSILLVEDDDMIRKLIVAGLRRFGHTVEEVSSGEEALAFLSEHSDEIAVVLTDIVLSGIDGVTLANRVAQMCPKLPVVLMSGYADTTNGELSEPRPFIAKPFAPKELATLLEQILARPMQALHAP